MNFKVKSNGVWLSIFKSLLLGGIVGGLLVILPSIMKGHFKILEPAIDNIYALISFVIFIAILALILLPLVLVSSVTVKEDELHGRSPMGFKKIIPFGAIDNVGFDESPLWPVAVTIQSYRYGVIYIYESTENLDELVKIIKSKI